MGSNITTVNDCGVSVGNELRRVVRRVEALFRDILLTPTPLNIPRNRLLSQRMMVNDGYDYLNILPRGVTPFGGQTAHDDPGVRHNPDRSGIGVAIE